MDDVQLRAFLKETKELAAGGEVHGDSADGVLEQLQRAVDEHSRILRQQEFLIRKLREELKDVREQNE